jgi:hypothetical protein
VRERNPLIINYLNSMRRREEEKFASPSSSAHVLSRSDGKVNHFQFDVQANEKKTHGRPSERERREEK